MATPLITLDYVFEGAPFTQVAEFSDTRLNGVFEGTPSTWYGAEPLPFLTGVTSTGSVGTVAPLVVYQVIKDDFNRANENPLAGATYEGVAQGWSWQAGLGTGQVVSNRAQAATLNGSNQYSRIGVNLASDHNYAQLRKYGASTTSWSCGVLCRANSTAITFYLCTIATFGGVLGITLWRCVNNTYTQLGATVPCADVDGDVIRIQAVGETITGWLNGVLLITRTDSTIESGTRAGYRLGTDTTTRFTLDDFEAGILPAPTAVTLRDDFNRANENPATNATVGGVAQGWAWETFNGSQSAQVVSNRLKSGTRFIDEAAVKTNTSLATNNHYAQFKRYGPSTGNRTVAVMVRVSSTAGTRTCYFAVVNPPSLLIYKYISGSPTNIASGTCADVDGDVLRLEAIGSQITAYLNGVQIVTVTDTAIPSGRRAGVRFSEVSGGDVGSQAIDDFEAGDIVEGTNVALTGVSAAGTIGTLGVEFRVALTGVVALGLSGDIGAPGAGVLSGVVSTGQVGNLEVLFELGLTGVEVEGNVNTLIPGFGFTLVLVGVSATASVGSLIASLSGSALRGVSATARVGSMFVLEPPKIDGMTVDSPVLLTPKFTGEVELSNSIGAVGQVFTSRGPNVTPEWAYPSGTAVPIEQPFASQTTVTIAHARGYHPQVTVIDSDNCIMVPMQVFHSDTDTVVVSFSVAETGTVIIL